MQSAIGVVPFYMSWGLASILMINRPYGRPAIGIFVALCCFAEGFLMYQYGTPYVEELLTITLQVFPDNYSFFDCKRLFQQLFPIALSVILALLDLSLDKLPEDEKDPLFILTNIVQKEEELLKEVTDIIKELEMIDDENLDEPEIA
jgi:hypothetical protein